MTQFHNCKENDEYHLPIFKDGNNWSMECPDGWAEIEFINYCPFCGVKLE